MGTRATIKFTDDDETYYVYRGHDGFPDNILKDIDAAIKESKGRWSNPELGCLVTLMLTMFYDYEKIRLPDYELTQCFHGDESYRYYVNWDGKEYQFGISF
jgi:hypothetical protein